MSVIGIIDLVVARRPMNMHSLSQGQICFDKCMFYRTEIEEADQTRYLTQSQHRDNWPTSPSADPTNARGRYHGGRRPSSDDSLYSPTVIPPSALDKPSIMKRYHRRRTCSQTSPRRSPTMVTLHDTGFVECRWRNDGWTVKIIVT